MNEVHDVQPGHIYQPGNKKEVRLVYRILSGPYCGRHQKSFSLTKWGVAGAWDAAQQAKAYMLQTGRLPPSFASPYSRSKLTNASANAIVLSKPLQPPRPLVHPGAVAGGPARADAAALLASAATGAPLSLDTANAAIAAAATRFLPLDSFAVAAAARSIPPHHVHGEKDGGAPALAFPAFSDGLAPPFPSFLPPPTFPNRSAAGTPPSGGWSYLSSVHATLAAAAMAQRATAAGSAEPLAPRENAEENAPTGNEPGPHSFEQENGGRAGCAEPTICGLSSESGNGAAPVMNAYSERLTAHPSELVGVHMLPGAPGPPPFGAPPTADGVAGAPPPSSSSTPAASTATGTTCTTPGDVNPAAAAATAFTLLHLAEQNTMLPQAKDQQQLNHNALQHFMLLHQLQMMQEKQHSENQQAQGGPEGLCPLKPHPLHGFAPVGGQVDGADGDGTGAPGKAEGTSEATDTETRVDAGCAGGATGPADSDLTRAGTVEGWQNEDCSTAPMGSTPAQSQDAPRLAQGTLTCRSTADTMSHSVGSVSAAPDNFSLLQDQQQHEQQHHPQEQESHKQEQQERPQNAPGFSEGHLEATPGMRETLRDLLIAASLQQQRLQQQELTVGEQLHGHHPAVNTLAMGGLPLDRPATETPGPSGMLNISALASLLPGAVLSHKQQTPAEGMLIRDSPPNQPDENCVGTSCCVLPGPRGEGGPAESSVLGDEKLGSTLPDQLQAGKDVSFPSQLSVLWGMPPLDPLAVKNRNPVTSAAGAAGHCGAPNAPPLGPHLETVSALASPATLDGNNFPLLNESAAAAPAARLKGLNDCADVVLNHRVASSSQGAADLEGECEAMSSCQSENPEDCEKGADDSYPHDRAEGGGTQASMLQSLSASPLQLMPAARAVTAPLRLSGVLAAGAVNATGPVSTGERCLTLIHSDHSGNMAPARGRERATTVSEGDNAAAVTDASALRMCNSPNNTPSRTSSSRGQPYCASAAAGACSNLSEAVCGRSRDAFLPPVDTDTKGPTRGESTVFNNLLHVGQMVEGDTNLPIGGVREVGACGPGAADAPGAESIITRTFTRRDGTSTDTSDCADARAPKGAGVSAVFDDLAVGPNEATRNDADTDEEAGSSSTGGVGTEELMSRCIDSDSSRRSRSELRRRREVSPSTGADSAGTHDSNWISGTKKNRAEPRAYGTVVDSVSSDSQDEEQTVRTRLRTAEGKKIAPGSAEASRSGTVGRHHTRGKLCF